MGRSSKAEAAQNRQRVLQAASDLFRARNIETVTVADIMTRAGMTPGGFYKHFASKDALVAEACVLAFHNAADAWTHEVSQVGNGQALQKLIACYFAPKPAERACPMLTFGPAAAASSPDHLFAVAYRDGVRELLAAFTAVAETDCQPDAAQLRLLFSAMVGVNFLSRALGPEPLAENLQQTVHEQSAQRRRPAPNVV